jgi:L-ascorbate metabolism protein UlaG (beta-lactamase superfamily)
VSVRVTHIGGPTVLIEVGKWRLLTDPTFDPPGRRYSFGLGTSSRKLAGPSVSAEEIGRVDAVLLSHDQHEDNLDEAGRELLSAADAVITTRKGAERLGEGAVGLDPWEATTLEGGRGKPAIEVTSTPSRHGAPLMHVLSGPTTGFALSWEKQKTGVLWISGDSVLYPGLREAAERLDVGVAILHLGNAGFPITGPLRFTMNAKQAVELCGEMRPEIAVPIHYEGWKHFREGRDGIERELEKANPEVAGAFRWLPIGEPTDLPI